jgi:hypothetical protein
MGTWGLRWGTNGLEVSKTQTDPATPLPKPKSSQPDTPHAAAAPQLRPGAPAESLSSSFLVTSPVYLAWADYLFGWLVPL